MKSIGIIGNGFVGKAIYNGFTHYSDVKVYDKDPRKTLNTFDDILKTDICFLCLPTPMHPETYAADTNIIDSVVEKLNSNKYTGIIIIKSTVPIGYTQGLSNKYKELKLIHSPEFLTARTANIDFINASRHIFGRTSNLDYKHVSLLLQFFNERFPGALIFTMRSEESELVKYICNTFFSTKISFFNEMYLLAKKLNVDWSTVISGVLADGRIGKSHYQVPGHDGEFGFGGACFPKDLFSLIQQFNKNDITPSVLESVWNRNISVRKTYDWDGKVTAITRSKEVDEILQDMQDAEIKNFFKLNNLPVNVSQTKPGEEIVKSKEDIPDLNRVVVIGGAGFIGSNLVKYLSENTDKEIYIIDDFSTGKKENLKFILGNPKIKVITADISDTNAFIFNNIFYGAKTIFHLAAKARVQPSIINPIDYNKVNVDGTLRMLKCASDQGVENFIYSSSSSVYGDTEIFPTPETAPTKPMSPYAMQKLIGEQYCKLYSEMKGIKTVCLRYFNVYGNNMLTEGAYSLVLGKWKTLLEQHPDIKLPVFGDGEQKRDFTHVDDIVNGNILAWKYCENTENVKGEVFNLGRGDNKSINEIASYFPREIEYLPQRHEPKQTLADNTKAKKLLNWFPQYNVSEWLPQYLSNK